MSVIIEFLRTSVTYVMCHRAVARTCNVIYICAAGLRGLNYLDLIRMIILLLFFFFIDLSSSYLMMMMICR